MATSEVSVLAEPVVFPFSGKTALNRFSKAAMTERLCSYSEDEFVRGEPTRELERVYELWGKGGLGIFHTGNIMIHRTCLEAKGCAIIDPDIPKSYIPAFKRLRHAATSQLHTPPVLIGQLAHFGGQPSLDFEHHPVVAAGKGSSNGGPDPVHWTREGIRDVVQRFAFAAQVLRDAEFDGVQIHGAYGNIITQLLSSTLNTRTDEYGGSFENRVRIITEIVVAVKECTKDPTFILGVKLNTSDFLEGGLTPQEFQGLAQKLEETQVDYIELSGGTYEGFTSAVKSNRRQEHFLLSAEQLRSGLKRTRLTITGGFKTTDSMICAVKSGVTDFIGLARSLTHEPMLVNDLLSQRISCTRTNKLPQSLAINLDAGILQIYRMGKGLEPKDFSNQLVVDDWMKERYLID